jgi:glucose-1-phosphate adenylyltransferase
MLLAGGEGTRLGVLTQNVAKPAVRFGGEYRIIDFSLSNCINSGIDTIGVLTQYKPSALNSHIGELTGWDLNRADGGISILPPVEGPEGTSWYTGTANAVYQNFSFIEQFNPEYVLIVSGDHVYNMDYRDMLEFHKQTDADVSISVMPVKWEEASRFGIISADSDHRVTRFTEKPAKPDSNLASMGIYIFKWSVLKAFLSADEQNDQSSHDFGKDVIPCMLEKGARLTAYPFRGYWRDVGTVESLWEAHMDLLEDKPLFQLNRKEWPLRTLASAVAYSHKSKRNAQVERSIIASDVEVGAGSVITECIIMPNVKIGRNVTIHKAIIAEGAIIEDGATIGYQDYNEITVIAENQIVPGKLVKISRTLLPKGFQVRAGAGITG